MADVPTSPVPRPSGTEVRKYIDSAMKKLEENPKSLEPYERRLLSKIRKSSQAAQQAAKDCLDLRNQIAQAEARMRSLELQTENHQGSVNAYIEEIVYMKFNFDELVAAPPPPDSDKPRKGLKAVKGD